jgi:hypothetical protein
MRIRRAIIIPAILALGATGSVLASSATSVAAGQVASTHVLAASSTPGIHYRA